MDFIFYVFEGTAGHALVKRFPLRSMRISFPTLPSDNPDNDLITYARFDGQFGTNYSDSRHLWKYLQKSARNRRRRTNKIISIVNNQSTSVGASESQAHDLMPNESPDGSRTEFTFPYVIWGNTAIVKLNGIVQRESINYSWQADPQTLVFVSPPSTSDTITIDATVSSGGI